MARDSAYSPASLRTCTTNEDSWIICFYTPASAIAIFAEWESQIAMEDISTRQ
jgi:hypothetical protein